MNNVIVVVSFECGGASDRHLSEMDSGCTSQETSVGMENTAASVFSTPPPLHVVIDGDCDMHSSVCCMQLIEGHMT